MRQSQIIGLRGELMAMEALTAAGATVCRPLDDAPYDLIAEYKHKLIKIQVKTRDTSDARVLFGLRHRDAPSGGSTRTQRYQTADVDLFCLVNLQRGIVTLRPHDGTKQTTTINYNKITSSNVLETLELFYSRVDQR